MELNYLKVRYEGMKEAEMDNKKFGFKYMCCPFSVVGLVNGSEEGQSCGTWCPHFEYVPNNAPSNAEVVITCSGLPVRLKVKEKEREKE
jgi:hypothetical protein